MLENKIIPYKNKVAEGENDMAERCDVLARVISQKGTCAQEHKVGDEWVIKDTTPGGYMPRSFQFTASSCVGTEVWWDIYLGK